MTNWKPVPGHIFTPWAEKINPENILPEYPRPQMTRPDWLNLNGLWDYAITPKSQTGVDQFQGQILVPFPVESALSGVKQPLLPEQLLWYRRTFELPKKWKNKSVLLHFGAVDWKTTIWLNDVEIGTHRGGFTPFSFDITLDLQPDQNEILISVWDPTETHWQARGKQVLNPKSIWYTAVSGIWQTVWLEAVPETHIQSLKITPDIDFQQIRLEINAKGKNPDLVYKAQAFDQDGKKVASAESQTSPLILNIPDPHLWSPDTPYLYTLDISLHQKRKKIDQVGSYFGMRKFSLEEDHLSRPRIFLNNEPLFHYGPLDQGYWPDGLFTPPTEEAMLSDLEFCKQAGFNMLRKHIKMEPARYYYHCDRLGLIVWQDMPNGGKAVGNIRSLLAILFGHTVSDKRLNRALGRTDHESKSDFKRELAEMLEALHNFPSIGMWVPFNEAWGQFEAKEIGEWVKQQDPSRLVDHASGWYDQGGSDFKSPHVYFKKLKPHPPVAPRGVILSEFGGYLLKLDGHAWHPDKTFGYRKYPDRESLTQAYLDLLETQLQPWIDLGLSGAVYTQTTDVEIELNGFLTYDRKVTKIDTQTLADAHRKLIQSAKT